MMAVAGGDGSLLVSRDSHKSIVAGLIFSGVQPSWITPQWDAEHLRSGVDAGMNLPDAADPSLKTIRVLA